MMAVNGKIMLVLTEADQTPTIGTRGLRRNAGAFSGKFPDSNRPYQMASWLNSIQSFIDLKNS
jgi:hypothetical protein